MSVRRSGLLVFGIVMLIMVFGAMAPKEVRGGEAMSLGELLPRQIEGWQSSSEDAIYTRDTLFDYMNGAGEIYLAYDFHRLLVREYVRESAPSIAAEIYQMSSPTDAYGIFSHDTDGDEVALGQGAIYAMGLLRLWKGRIFIRLLAERETDEAKAMLMALGGKIANAIPQEGKKPLMVACLPLEGLLKESIHYFHKQVSLNCHYYLADSNLLNLSEKTEVVLARYQWDDRKIRLLLVRYREPKEAKASYEQFGRIYFPEKPSAASRMRVEEVERGEFVSARWADRFIILVFEASDRKTCGRLTEAVVKKVKEVF